MRIFPCLLVCLFYDACQVLFVNIDLQGYQGDA